MAFIIDAFDGSPENTNLDFHKDIEKTLNNIIRKLNDDKFFKDLNMENSRSIRSLINKIHDNIESSPEIVEYLRATYVDFLKKITQGEEWDFTVGQYYNDPKFNKQLKESQHSSDSENTKDNIAYINAINNKDFNNFYTLFDVSSKIPPLLSVFIKKEDLASIGYKIDDKDIAYAVIGGLKHKFLLQVAKHTSADSDFDDSFFTNVHSEHENNSYTKIYKYLVKDLNYSPTKISG